MPSMAIETSSLPRCTTSLNLQSVTALSPLGPKVAVTFPFVRVCGFAAQISKHKPTTNVRVMMFKNARLPKIDAFVWRPRDKEQRIVYSNPNQIVDRQGERLPKPFRFPLEAD